MPPFTKPTKLPEWASGDAASVVEPLSGEKSLGWLAGQTPPAPYMNWLMGGDFGYYPWLQYVSTFEQQALTWPERQTFQKGFAASGQRSTIAGLDVTSGLAADSATVAGALTAGATTLASASVTGTAQAGTVQTANFAPLTTGGTITLPGNMTLMGGTATLTTTTVSATLGNFSSDVVLTGSGFFRGKLEVTSPSPITFLNSWTEATSGQSFYQLDRTGRIWIYLEDVYGGVVGSGTPIFTLPVSPTNVRPNRTHKFPTSKFVPSPVGTLFLYVNTAGSVYVLDSGASLNGTTLTVGNMFTVNASMIQVR